MPDQVSNFIQINIVMSSFAGITTYLKQILLFNRIMENVKFIPYE